ncbi:MAG: cytochrome c biogenesis protein CcsA [Chitinophagaceae bacterium]|nr:cytochrome c biogenesis protein CcsA [Chitinophagaceae bacterium]
MNSFGEHLLPGQIGHFLIILSLVASLIATIAYSKSTNALIPAEAASWKKIGRTAFVIDAFSVFGVFALIYYIISNHYMEYSYAWTHSDKSLEPKYLLSSIWEGQEGSFLLWAFWHGVIGIVLMKTSKKWEAPVMAVISFAQLCIATLLLGIFVFDLKVGSNPFILLKDSGVMSPENAPAFYSNGILRGDYLELIHRRGGQGLNQLLQNYWMVIHPPILFLGFASTIVPFAYAIAGLWTKDYGGWTKSQLPWSLFSAAILALGIMMGAKWAYESLNFGGYWAWDPVENASLVPWLIMIAGLHTQLIFNATGHSLRSTYLFYLLSFMLILYSTYLARSGDLQDTSVHAFVTSGMNWQLRIFVFAFVIPGLLMFALRYKKIPHIVKEESSWSREFWMFIGSLVLFLSSLAIIIPTSFPLFNKIFGTSLAIGEDQEFAYNRIQIFVAIIIGVITAIGQYLKYKTTNRQLFFKKLMVPTIIALIFSLIVSIFGNIDYDKYGIGYLAAIHLGIFASLYAVVANTSFIWLGLNGKLKAAGASVAHLGFSLFLLGALISSAKKEVLSVNKLNPLNFGPDQKEKGEENLTMFQGIETDMGDFWATYAKDSSTQGGKTMYFHIQMKRKDGKGEFMLVPDLIKNSKGQEGYSANPDAKHYLHKDIFTYISYADKMREGEDTSKFRPTSVAINDTVFYSSGIMILDTVQRNPANKRVQFTESDTAIMATIRVIPFNSGGKPITAQPYFYFRNNRAEYFPDTLITQGLAINLNKFAADQTFEIGVKESTRMTPFIALKVLVFPFINLVWGGVVLMLVGFVMAIVRRVKTLKA